MVNTPSPIDADLAPSATPEHGPDPVSMRTDLWLFVGMLVLAVGLGFLDQLSVFALALPVAVLAVWMVVRRSIAAKL
jgi:hypothetical protein